MAAPVINPLAFYSTRGPQLLYWCPASSQSISAIDYSLFAYLGTTVKAPEVSFQNPYENVMNSLGGTALPTDKSYQGSSATIVCPINRFSESSLRRLMAVPYHHGSGSSTAVQDAGNYSVQDLGSLSYQDAASFMLVVMNLFGGNPGSSLNMPFGRIYYQCTWPEAKEIDATTIPVVETLVFEATPCRFAFSKVGNTFFNANIKTWDYIDSLPAALPPPT